MAVRLGQVDRQTEYVNILLLHRVYDTLIRYDTTQRSRDENGIKNPFMTALVQAAQFAFTSTGTYVEWDGMGMSPKYDSRRRSERLQIPVVDRY